MDRFVYLPGLALLAIAVALASSQAPGVLAGAAPPPNDDFADATEIASLPFSETVDLEGATVEDGEAMPICIFPPGSRPPTAWYRHTATEDATLVASAIGEGFLAGVAVWVEEESGLRNVNCPHPYGFAAQVAFDAQAGRTYYLQVTGSFESAFSLKATVQPSHDDAAAAMTIPSLPFSDVVNLGAATQEPDEPLSCHPVSPASLGPTVWYSFTPDEDMVAVVDVADANFSVLMNVLEANSEALQRVACRLLFHDDRIAVELEAGQLYYFQLGGALGTLAFELTEGVPPPNDAFADAIDIGMLPFQAAVDTIAARVEPSEPVPTCSDNVGTSVWYRVTPPDASIIVADVVGDDVRPQLGVYRGDALGGLTQVMCGLPSSGRVLMGFEADAGETYYIQVAGYSQKAFLAGDGAAASFFDGGNLTLELTTRELPSCPEPQYTVADRSDDVHVFFDMQGLQYHDIISTGVSTTNGYLCVQVNFTDDVILADPADEHRLTGGVYFDFDIDDETGFVASACDFNSLFGVDLAAQFGSGFGRLAALSRSGIPAGTEFGVTMYEGATMVVAIPREFVGDAEVFRYAVSAFTEPHGVGGGHDCSPDRRYIHVPELPLGDGSCDGAVNALDAAAILQFSAGMTFYVDCHYLADADADGTVGSIDASLILQMDAGLLDALPGAASAQPGEPAAGQLLGDANCDGEVSAIDATILLQIDAALIEPSFCLGTADANQDGLLDARDALLALQMHAGLIPATPPAVDDAVLAAMLATADMAGVEKERIALGSQEAMTWPDGCLGLGEPGEACTEAVVEGYRIGLQVWFGALLDPLPSPTAIPAEFYLWRTNQDGTVLRLEGIAVP